MFGPCFTLHKHAAMLTQALGHKDTFFLMLCLGCLPLPGMGGPAASDSQLWKPAALTGDSPLWSLLLLHLPVLHTLVCANTISYILACANTYHSSAACVLENILTGDCRREGQLNAELSLQVIWEASVNYYHVYLFAKHLPFQSNQRVLTWRYTTDRLCHQQSSWVFLPRMENSKALCQQNHFPHLGVSCQ